MVHRVRVYKVVGLALYPCAFAELSQMWIYYLISWVDNYNTPEERAGWSFSFFIMVLTRFLIGCTLCVPCRKHLSFILVSNFMSCDIPSEILNCVLKCRILLCPLAVPECGWNSDLLLGMMTSTVIIMFLPQAQTQQVVKSAWKLNNTPYKLEM